MQHGYCLLLGLFSAPIIPRRSGYTGMTGHFSDGGNVCAGVQQITYKRAPQVVRAKLLYFGLDRSPRQPGANCPGFSEHLTMIHDGEWAAYKYVDFGHGVVGFQAHAASLAYGGTIELHLDRPDGLLVGVCQVPCSGGWQKWETVACHVQGAATIHALYLVFRGRLGRLFNLKSFSFLDT